MLSQLYILKRAPPSNEHFSFLETFFSFKAPVERLCCKPNYRANIIHHFIFVFFLYFFHHSSCRKDQFTVLIFKFGTQDFTDPGDPHWFVVEVLLSQVFLS